ncbi:Retrovirus-related Pol polyprotein from transposon 17.6 [Trichinella sp. T6]|nr:Retrovirus-related Pol polyprotein from transposon 17.6 [Trichinella sp. T6]
MPRLSRRHYRLWEDKGGASGTTERGVVQPAVRETEDHAGKVPTDAAERTLPGPHCDAAWDWRFVRNFAGSNPLHALTKKGEKWHCGPKEEEAFARLKDALRRRHRSSVVAARRAGPTGVGPVRQPLALTVGAGLLRDAEGDAGPSLGHSPLPPYLYGRKFTARTDHNSLKWLRNFWEPEGQVARWLEKLAEFDFEVVHRPGKKHKNADALSRRACRDCGSSDDCLDIQVAGMALESVSPVGRWQKKDAELMQVVADHPEAEHHGNPDCHPQSTNGGPFRGGKNLGKSAPALLLAPAAGGRGSTRASAYHPQSDGLVERMNRTLLDMLTKAFIDHPEDWDVYLERVLMSYRTSVYCTTGATPSRVVFGRELWLPVDHLRGDLERVYEMVRKKAGREQRRQKAWKDRKAYRPVYEPVDQKKLDWNMYQVEKMKGGRERLVVHFHRLKPYHGTRQGEGAQGRQQERRETRRSAWLQDFMHYAGVTSRYPEQARPLLPSDY